MDRSGEKLCVLLLCALSLAAASIGKADERHQQLAVIDKASDELETVAAQEMRIRAQRLASKMDLSLTAPQAATFAAVAAYVRA